MKYHSKVAKITWFITGWALLALYFLSGWRYSPSQSSLAPRKPLQTVDEVAPSVPSPQLNKPSSLEVVKAVPLPSISTLPQAKERSEEENQESKELEDSEDSEPKDQGYVLTLQFTGQQVAGMRGIFSQQCWLNSFNLPLSIVEPFIVKSTIVHTRDVWESEDSKALKLSNFYKMSSGMTSWDTFLLRAPRELIVVNVGGVYAKNCLEYKRCNDPSMDTADINMSSCRPTKAIRTTLAYLKEHNFKVARTVCLDCSLTEIHTFTPKQIVRHIFAEHSPKDVTVLISHWKFSFYMTPTCSPSACAHFTKSIDSIEAPSKLEEDAIHYNQVIDKMQEHSGEEIAMSISVMVRLEWFLIEYKDRSLENLRTCLQGIKTKTDELTSGKNTRIVLALDVGRFGSGSFGVTKRLNSISEDYFEKLLEEVKKFVVLLYNGKVDFDAWEDSFLASTNGVTDRGYIAALQSLVVSKAKCLVLVGGGHFQAMAVQKHQSYHPTDTCIHKVCAED